jgi:hypothetical protein
LLALAANVRLPKYRDSFEFIASPVVYFSLDKYIKGFFAFGAGWGLLKHEFY